MKGSKIPRNFFLFWSGQDFTYAHYISVLSILRTNRVERCEVYYDTEPVHNADWERLKKTDNVMAAKVDFDNLLKKAGLNKSDFDDFFGKVTVPHHPSELFRYLILKCYGGIYIDFDMIVIKDFGPLLNAEFYISYQHYEGRYPLNGAVLGSIKESPCLKLCLEEVIRYSRTHAQFSWLAFGPELLSDLFFRKTLAARCILRIFNFLSLRGVDGGWLFGFLNGCIKKRDLNYEIYPKSYFFPYSWPRWEEIFKKNPLPRHAYAVHWWNSKSQEIIKTIDADYIKNSDSLFALAVRASIKEQEI